MAAELIRVTGIVQGVGFRPTVWRLAQECGLVGQVWNDAEGVGIEAWGELKQLDRFAQRLLAEAPPLARIDSVKRSALHNAVLVPESFSIQASRSGAVRTGVAADAATCPACLAEVFDPSDRRYRYPFTNCTHCGPRLSIVRAIPYDRTNTSMSTFPMCADCQAEYADPGNRRFHAQPNACPVCGPQVWLEDANGDRLEPDPDYDAIEMAARLICRGYIVAIKGIGGIHLACDAANAQAVAMLRQRKQRYQKAFALMARDVAMVRRYARLNAEEQALLLDQAAPIVVLQAAGDSLASGIAPGQHSLGFMLPYTPLHHLLMQNIGRPIVLTSGNRSDEPQTIDNLDAHRRLDKIADYYLLHDREIVNRLDDSVLRFADGKPRLLRRARGYAPQPLLLPPELAADRSILAMGGELKNTFCLLKEGKAIVSQHMGDLEDAATYGDYLHNLELYQDLYGFSPDLVVVDKHPNYLSTHVGERMSAEMGVPLLKVQHHYAHILSCVAEHGVTPDYGKVLGMVLDGLGYGDDRTIWGGEFLLADYQGFARVGYFQPVAMPGGVQSIREPWRNTYAHLSTCIGWQDVQQRYGGLELVRYLSNKPLGFIQQMMDKGLNSPAASSAGRLFDAVAAALGVCPDFASYEGQAAIELEALAQASFESQDQYLYPYENAAAQLNWRQLWLALLDDIRRGEDKGVIAARFHHTLAAAVSDTAWGLAMEHDVETVILNGGVMQNRLLLEQTARLLRNHGLRVLVPERLPANDGGLSLGQAVAAIFNTR